MRYRINRSQKTGTVITGLRGGSPSKKQKKPSCSVAKKPPVSPEVAEERRKNRVRNNLLKKGINL